MKSWQERDLLVNWHPYTQHHIAPPPIPIVKAKGAILWDENGKPYIDGISSWWTSVHGHGHPQICKVLYKQSKRLDHVLFGGVTHPSAVELSEQLLRIIPFPSGKIFYSDNGSTAVEVALKMALQYHHVRGERRTDFIAFQDAYHGDTFGAMAASGIAFFTREFKDFFVRVHRIPLPNAANWEVVKQKMNEILNTYLVAGFIFEPLVQGAAGMRFYSAEHLEELIRLAQSHGVLCIADEVMTGFWKTGKWLAAHHVNTIPDIICVSKSLSGGVLPLAATAVRQGIFEAFLADDPHLAFFHGHTYMANPIACAAALASLRLFRKKRTQERLQQHISRLAAFAESLAHHPRVCNVRHVGMILAFDIRSNKQHSYYGELRNWLYNFFSTNGILLRPIANTIYLMPPYVIGEEDWRKITHVVLHALDELPHSVIN